MPDVQESGVRGPVVSPEQHDQVVSWLGRRVVVRHLLGDGRATDVLGTLTEVAPLTGAGGDAPGLVVDTDGAGPRTTVRVRLDAVVALKPVPPRPARRVRS